MTPHGDAGFDLVIGLGSMLRRDDAAGLWAAQHLVASIEGRLQVVAYGGDAAGLLELLCRCRSAVVIDAVRSGRPPGTVHPVDVAALGTGRRAGAVGSHRASLDAAVALGVALGRGLPPIRVIGIEIEDASPGEGLTAPVAAAVDRVVAVLLEEFACTSSI